MNEPIEVGKIGNRIVWLHTVKPTEEESKAQTKSLLGCIIDDLDKEREVKDK